MELDGSLSPNSMLEAFTSSLAEFHFTLLAYQRAENPNPESHCPQTFREYSRWLNSNSLNASVRVVVSWLRLVNR